MAQDRPSPSIVTLDEQLQRERAQRRDDAQDAARRSPDVRLETSEATDFHSNQLPRENDCVVLTRVLLRGERSDAFGFAQRYLDRYAGRCAGHAGISLIVRRTGDLILDHGYVTTRVGLSEQDVSKGVLTVTVVPGVLHTVRVVGNPTSGDWHWALPMRPGDLLNLRDIEQGLEQLKRVPSQDISMDIEPAEAPGQSDLVITVKRTKPWRFVATLDDSGASGTGMYQSGINLGIDNPLGANDVLSLGVTHDVLNSAGRGTQGISANYSIPYGNLLFAASLHDYRYHQLVGGSAQTFDSNGRYRSIDLMAQRLLHRNQNSKTTAELHIGKRWAHSFIEDVELDSQRRDMSAIEATLSRRQYLGNAQLDLRVAERFGVRWFGGQHDPSGHPHESPTFNYRLTTLDASLSLPFRLRNQSMQWTSEAHAQYSGDYLYGSEYIGIGGRYTVRGFDGDQTLSAERGWYWRNTFTFPAGHWPFAWYAGADTGRVYGPGTAYNPANTSLSGVFFGLRGSNGEHVSWDAFAGKALHGRTALPRTRAATGFQLVYTY